MTDPLPRVGARELLEATYEREPSAVNATVLVAFQTAGGDWARAADELGLEPLTLLQWVERLGLEQVIAERWPRQEKESK